MVGFEPETVEFLLTYSWQSFPLLAIKIISLSTIDL